VNSNKSLSEAPTESRQSVCPMDCPDRCSLEVEVSDGRVASIRGNRVLPLTSGFICTKVNRFTRRLYGPDRVLFPLRRKGPKGGGNFARITWDEAVADIAEMFQSIVRSYGGEAVLPFYYGGSNGLLTQNFVDAHFFHRLGASRLARTICAASTSAALDALYGKMPGAAFEDYAEAKFILIWGACPTNSNIHLVPHLKAAKKRGAKIAVVDPRMILGHDLMDISLQLYPGSDVAVALAMIHHLERQGLADRAFLSRYTSGWQELFGYAERFPLERAARLARVPASAIARLAEAYAGADPALLRCGWGLERNRNGLASVAAALALPAVADKFGKAGSGYTLSNSGAFRLDDTKLAGVREADTRVLNMNLLGRILMEDTSPPVRALFVYNANPTATVPNRNLVLQGLRREDLFTVVLDQVMTDTAAFADIVLPATTFLEHRELNKSYGAYALQLAEPVVEPQGEAKCNSEVFQLLGNAMGWTDGLFAEDPEALLRRAFEAVRGPLEAGMSLESLRERRIAFFDFPGPRPVQFSTVFPGTSDGKIHLYPASLGSEPYRYLEDPALPAFPLALISPSSNKTISSTMGEYNLPVARLEMSPQDAGERGLSEGDRMRVFNELGEVYCFLKVESRLRPGVVSLAKGIWRRATLNGSVSTSLVPDRLTPVSGGACFNDARVQVERL
jgi:anaerobic selenocysteine-containing dehydrogenase